jgi:antitoxin (DNA-binding transcriptional repressor) of toxin-antitoxin stability system
MVAAGERVVISKAGTPIADLVPHQAVGVTFGGLKGEVAYTDDAFSTRCQTAASHYGYDVDDSDAHAGDLG